MKKTILILAGVALLMILLIFRLFYKQNNGLSDEREWFVKALRYEFSAKVDSVSMFNPHAGRLRCLLSYGDPKIHREDSLKKLFKEHDMLYLIFKRSADTITFVLPNRIKMVLKGDSVHISSSENKIQFFRDNQLVLSDSLTETLTGFSRPFFLKD